MPPSSKVLSHVLVPGGSLDRGCPSLRERGALQVPLGLEVPEQAEGAGLAVRKTR